MTCSDPVQFVDRAPAPPENPPSYLSELRALKRTPGVTVDEGHPDCCVRLRVADSFGVAHAVGVVPADQPELLAGTVFRVLHAHELQQCRVAVVYDDLGTFSRAVGAASQYVRLLAPDLVVDVDEEVWGDGRGLSAEAPNPSPLPEGAYRATGAESAERSDRLVTED